MNAVIKEKEQVARDCYRLALECALPPSVPGQFVMVRVRDGIAPLLRRPMSIAGHANGALEVIFKVMGQGTAILADLREGDAVDVTGPFGNGFSAPEGRRVVLVGGGVGIPPLLYYARTHPGKNLSAVIGGASADDIFGDVELIENCGKVAVTTEDGSTGYKGMVTRPLLDFAEVKKGEAFIIACGPGGMLKAVDLICREKELEGEISTEEKMGCGFGVCLGCMAETTDGRKPVCKDGPVFKAGELVWA